MKLRAEWAEEAIMDAARAWQGEEMERREGQKAAETESQRWEEVEKAMRKQLKPEAGECKTCVDDYDFLLGGFCGLHQAKLAALCAAAAGAAPAHVLPPGRADRTLKF
jgi:hypothetical protein